MTMAWLGIEGWCVCSSVSVACAVTNLLYHAYFVVFPLWTLMTSQRSLVSLAQENEKIR